MSLKHLVLAILLTVCILAPQVVAQRNELSGLVGRTFISDQGIKGALSSDPQLRFGNGLTFEVNYARRILDGGFWSLNLEVPFVLNPDEDLHAVQNVVPKQYFSLFVTPAARLNVFPDSGLSPWISFGGGFGHFSESSDLVFGGPNPGNTGTNTGVLQAGVGLDVKIVRGFSLRGEARDFWSGVPQLNVDSRRRRCLALLKLRHTAPSAIRVYRLVQF